MLLTATHTHSVPRQDVGPYTDKIVESARLAKRAWLTARIGYGTGVSYFNVNRNIIDPKTRRWWEGPNYEGPSDKTVAVIAFETPSGEPIAVYYNYAMHAVTVGQLDLVSGDAPGTASKYIEDSFDGNVVALWSSGAAGDQNPIYFQQTYDLREIRIKDYAERGVDISNAMPPGGQGLDRQDPAVIRLMNQQKQMIQSMGQFFGEEVLHVMRGMERTQSDVRIAGRHKIVTCPGRERTNEGRAGFPGEYREAAPVEIRLGVLALGDISDRRRERRGVQPDRAALEARVALRAHDDGHADERHGALGLHPARRRLRHVHVRGAVVPLAARLRGIGDRRRAARAHGGRRLTRERQGAPPLDSRTMSSAGSITGSVSSPAIRRSTRSTSRLAPRARSCRTVVNGGWT